MDRDTLGRMPKPPRNRVANDEASSASRTPRSAAVAPDVRTALDWLRNHATKATLEGMARYAIPADHAFGNSMTDIQSLAKQLGRNHALAAQLWDTGWYEARLLAAYVDDPTHVTPKQMDQWCRDFDNWALCDTVCFALFDRTPHAWNKIEPWSRREQEFGKRAAFALLWGLSVHDKGATDDRFTKGLQLVERAAGDERHFVKKAVNMALRAIGKRSPTLNAAALAVAERLAASPDPVARGIGKDSLRELTSPAVAQRLTRKPRAAR